MLRVKRIKDERLCLPAASVAGKATLAEESQNTI
jgi:hypothetical protein